MDNQPNEHTNNNGGGPAANSKVAPLDQNPDRAEAALGTTAATSRYDTGWSWGAFMLDAPFLIATRNYAWLLVYLLVWIPFLGWLIYLGLKIYLGMQGREMARRSQTWATAEERIGFFKGFDWAGKVLFFIMLAFFVFSLILVAIVGIEAFQAFESMQNMPFEEGFNNMPDPSSTGSPVPNVPTPEA